MRNCPSGGHITERKHCEAGRTCDWWVCEPCRIVFGPDLRTMPWHGKADA